MELASTKFFPKLDRRSILILALAAAISLAAYLSVSALVSHVGFPLDDSWIHLTYARNLALRGEWAFMPGVPSNGDTSPLWVVLLAPGFLLGMGPYIWTYLLGYLLLFALACVLEIALRQFSPTYSSRWPLAGLFICFEWHFVWAAGSGMETLLHSLLVTVILIRLSSPAPRPLTLGLLTGLTIWVRPDGLTMIGPALFTFLLADEAPGRIKMQRVFMYALGVLVLALPYLLFNLGLSGHPFPNTFYAKQSEYADWQMKPILSRLGILLLQFFNGPALILLFGVVVWVSSFIRARRWEGAAAFIWFVGYLSIYLLRLPPYQNGRYIMPAMPIFFMWGMLGLVKYYSQAAARPEVRQMRGLQATSNLLIAVTLIFWTLGVRSYARDVAYIENNMVLVARWADANLPSDALIAVHDIGAMGYFDQHALLDLAGLISPEVIPFMHDSKRLSDYLRQRGVNYLIVFSRTYPDLVSQSSMIFPTGQTSGPMDAEPLAVYFWK